MTIRHALTAAAGNTSPATPTDPQFNYVSMLLHGDGTNGAQNNTFVPTPITAPASGYYAGYFDGNGDYLEVPDNSAFSFGSGDFTIEAWIYPTAYAASDNDGNYITAIYTHNQSAPVLSKSVLFYLQGTASSYTKIAFNGSSSNTTSTLIEGNYTFALNTWAHVAVVRSGNNIYLYVNGTQVNSTTAFTLTLQDSTVTPKIGAAMLYSGFNYYWYFPGYMSNVRVVKGTAVYTANFTPPTAPLTAISGTSLLTCMSGTGVTFADLSTNNFTITANGNATMTGVATTPPSAAPYAGYFNGSAKLTVPAGTAFAYGTGDFTVEGWFYATTNLPAYGATLFAQTVSGTNYFWCLLGDGQFSPAQKVTFTFATSGGGTGVVSGATTYTQNTWNHFAIVRSSGSVTVYLNGVGGTPVACAQDFTNTTYVPTIGQYTHSTGNAFTGYLSNFRIVKGTAVYTSNFAPPSAPLTAISGTSLLTCQNATFVDNSPNNFTVTSSSATATSSYILPAITRNGNTTQGSLSPYGNLWSNYFDGTGDYLTVPDNAAFNFGSGDFTIEAWANVNSSGGLDAIVCKASQGWLVTIIASTAYIYFSSTGSSWNIADAVIFGTVTPGVWNHVAVTRSGTSIRAFLNGTLGATVTTSASIYNSTDSVLIGRWSGLGSTFEYKGYISNLRIVKGTALYTSAFTPSTTPLTAVSGTSLLTCQSNRFIDNSANNFTITRNGDVRVTKEAPFLPTAAYSTSLIGGSGYFDGTGDCIVTSSSSALTMGTGNFTIEVWYYQTAFSSSTWGGLVGLGSKSGGNISIMPRFGGSNNLVINTYGGTQLSTGAPIALNTWYHIAISRISGILNVYVNGTRVASSTYSDNLTGTQLVVGRSYTNTDEEYTIGFVSNLRVIKGVGIYSGTTISVPTAPLTAPINTSLLLDFTNAGIFDNAAENDLETVGNAQISTSVKKYGTGSMRFTAATDYLIPSESLPCAFGGANFTIEMWVYLNAYPSTYGVMYDARPSGGNGAYAAIYMDTTNIYYYVNTTNAITASLSTIGTGTWRHLAVSRSGTSTKMFIDGVQVGSTYTDTTVYLNPAQRPVIGGGGNAVGTYPMNGYIDDLRITKGYARYTSNFTPPTQAFPDQ
jgi:Concanavalin A-like lectin/glucanases superfamily